MATYKILDHTGQMITDNVDEATRENALSGGLDDGFGYYQWDTDLIEHWSQEPADSRLHDRIIQIKED